MKTSQLLLCIGIVGLGSCIESPDPKDQNENDRAQVFVDRGIAFIGGSILDNALVTFSFRSRDYVFYQHHGEFRYSRIHIDTAGTKTVDILTNNSLTRLINDEPADLDSLWTQRYSNSVNSVMYFAFLPYRLNDPAVIKTYNGLKTIHGKRYHEVEVQFAKEGGGVDHDDNFLYWLDEQSFALDYFAYDYITDGGGVRFRQAINRRKVNDLIVQDYVNYKPSDNETGLYGILEAFHHGELKELSKIELENVQVESLSEQ